MERAQSADMLFLKPSIEDDDARRASFDTTHASNLIQAEVSAPNVSRRRPGTGRKLPSTEMLKSNQNMQVGLITTLLLKNRYIKNLIQ